jgi:nuclear polyadenylated RNA-binding protein 3
MFLSPRLSLDAVIQRQAVEGVVAVSQLDLRAQNTSKISVRVYNRSAGVNNIRYDDYTGLEPKIAAELVLRDKQAAQAPPSNPYAPTPQQQYSQPPQLPYQHPPPVQQAPPQQSLAGLANLDNATLQKLLAGLNPAQQQNVPAVAQNSQVDIVGLLGMLNQQQQAATPQQQVPPPQPQYGVPPPQQQQQYGGYAVQSPVNGAAYGAPQQINGQSQAQGNAQSVQNIMAALAKARQ